MTSTCLQLASTALRQSCVFRPRQTRATHVPYAGLAALMVESPWNCAALNGLYPLPLELLELPWHTTKWSWLIIFWGWLAMTHIGIFQGTSFKSKFLFSELIICVLAPRDPKQQLQHLRTVAWLQGQGQFSREVSL